MKKALHFALLAGTLFSLTACETVYDARDMQSRKGDDRLRGERTARFEEYYKPGEILDLNALEAIALNANPKIFQAKQAVISAQLDVKNIRADYWPTLDAKASYTRGTNNTTHGDQNLTTHASRTSVADGVGGNRIELDLAWTLYDFGKRDAQLNQAVAKLLAAEKQLLATENDVRYAVRTAYFELRRCIELNTVTEQAVEQYKGHLDQMVVRRDVGKGSKYDCTKAEVDYNNAVLSSISTLNDIRTAWANLNLQLGFAESPSFRLGESSLYEYPEDVEILMNMAREREPGLSVLRAEEVAASAYLDKTIADLFPTIGISVSGTLKGDDLDMPRIWNLLGVGSITQNIFNAGRNLNAIESAVAQLRIARSKVAEYEQNLYSELTSATLVLARSRKQLEVAQLTQKAAAENLEIVTEQFNVGKASSLDRTDAQVSLTEASASCVSAQYDYLEALAKIAYIVGPEIH